MAKLTAGKSQAPKGWVPRIGGWRHEKTGVSVIRTITFDEGMTTDMEWRVLDAAGKLLDAYPSVTEALAFANSTVVLMEEP